MTILAQTLRPGLLVSLKTSVRGNVKYQRRDLEEVVDDGAQRSKWETERTITDPAEYERASKTRSKATSMIRGVCAASAFGLLCPESNRDRLDAALVDARKLVDDFNASSFYTHVSIYVIAGRVAQDDVEATRAIASEVRDLLQDMETGLSNLDVARVRDAARKARSVGTMLAPDVQGRLDEAISAARASARKIVAAGEQVAQEIDRETIARLAQARTAFLDIEEPSVEVEAPEAEARAIDLEPEQPTRTVSAAPIPSFEF